MKSFIKVVNEKDNISKCAQYIINQMKLQCDKSNPEMYAELKLSFEFYTYEEVMEAGNRT
jgi:hypothetical protein